MHMVSNPPDGMIGCRDVNFTRLHGYPLVISVTGQVLGEDFPPAGNEDGEFKYPFVK